MAIQKIEINGYRSLKEIVLNVSELVAFIGQNGSGKSNILSAINYFYTNLTREWNDEDAFDSNNPFRNEIKIRITYNMRRILRIVQRNKNIENTDYEKYYQKIQAIAQNDKIVLELIKRKGSSISWNVDYNTRQIIASIFPVYFVDARQIELTNWTEIWNLIGDFLKLRSEASDEIQKNIKDIINFQDTELEKKITCLTSALSKQSINVKKLTSRQVAMIIAEMAVGGQVFQYENRNLREYSNGTNAYNYTNLLIDILSLMNAYKLKEPIVVLDEPEISLHHMMVDSLMEKIFKESSSIQFFLSTHSARCVKDLLECEGRHYEIFHVTLNEFYSQIKKVRHLSAEESRERIIISEAYTNSCFAKMVLNVEGESELEVFKNKYLREIFPFLKETDIITGMSNQIIYNLTAPDKRNFHTAGLAVIDMDKMLVWQPATRRMKFNGLDRVLVSNESYYYGKKRVDTLYLKKRIENMCKKCNFYFKYPFYSCQDPNFNILLDLIIQYSQNYNIHVWHNTLEGVLINDGNVEMFKRFMKQGVLSREQLMNVEIYWEWWDNNINLNYIRQIFSGKNDFLLTKSQLKEANQNIKLELWNTLYMKKKTSGWISQWMEYYFLEKAGISRDSKDCFRQFSRYLKKENNYHKIIADIRKDFFELYSLLRQINKQMTIGL